MLLRSFYGAETFSIYDDEFFVTKGIADTIGHRVMSTSIEEMTADSSLYLVKTHELANDENSTVYVVRDGRDAVVSYARYLCSFKPRRSFVGRCKQTLKGGCFRVTLKRVIRGHEEFGAWGDHVCWWMNRSRRAKTLVVRYEEMVADPLRIVREVASFVGLKGDPAEVDPPSFRTLQRRSPEFFRRGRVGSARDEMPKSSERLFWRLDGEAMSEFGYDVGRRPEQLP
jgi:hypothetical protein